MLNPNEQAPQDGQIGNTPFYLVNQRDANRKATGFADIYAYLPNGSIGLKFASNVELFKTTLAALLAGTPGAFINVPSQGQDTPGDGGLVQNVNAQKQGTPPAHKGGIK